MSIEEYQSVITRTKPADRQLVKELFEELYISVNHSKPKVTFKTDPHDKCFIYKRSLVNDDILLIDAMIIRPTGYKTGLDFQKHNRITHNILQIVDGGFRFYNRNRCNISPYIVSDLEQKKFQLTKSQQLYIKTLKEAGKRVYLPDEVIVCEFPSVLKLNDENVLHCQDGPAIVFGNREFYAWNGLSIDKNWIMDKEKVYPVEILLEENSERRRIGLEIFGWTKILSELKSKVLDEDADPMIGKLVEVNVRSMDRPMLARFVIVRCGTGRDFAIPVPRTIETAIEGQAWMRGINLESFIKPEIRT